MYDVYAALRDKKGVRDIDVSRATGIGNSTFSDWKKGRSSPKDEKLRKIADYFGVDAEYLRTGKTEKKGGYYLDDEAKSLSQFLFENPEYRILFSAARSVKKDDIAFVKEFIDRIGGKNGL